MTTIANICTGFSIRNRVGYKISGVGGEELEPKERPCGGGVWDVSHLGVS